MARPLSLALQEYVVDWRRLPWPIRWDERFGRAAPLALEIGFGNGAFLVEQARAFPERDHVGLELSWTAARYLFRRAERVRLSNVRVLLGDAEALVGRHFAAESLAEVWVNHPCPWPKLRHAGRRLLARAFLGVLAERMRAGVRLTVATDHAAYAAWLAAELAAQPALVSCHATSEVPRIEGRTPTKYELRAMAQGTPIHYFEWRKAAPAPAARPDAQRALSGEITMPTLILCGEVASTELFHGFEPVLFRECHQDVDVVIKLEAVYRRAAAPLWLLETIVQEDRLRQRFGIDVIARSSTLLLKPSELGHPYPTHGVKRAVWCAARWLQSRHPGLAIQQESLGLPPPGEAWPAAKAQA